MPRVLDLGVPSPRQSLFLADTEHKYIAYGGARGGGKSWAVRQKAKLLALNYPGIKILIVRQTYRELQNNHIDVLTAELAGIAKYNDAKKRLTFPGGSTITFGYCSCDKDLMQYQGAEYDVIFIDEATNLTEHQLKIFNPCLRGVNAFPKRIYYTCNPGGAGHHYIKRLFVDRAYEQGEKPDDYAFYQALPQDNSALLTAQPDYIEQLQKLPKALREAWLYGKWDVFQGQFFEDFIINPAQEQCDRLGLDAEELRRRHQWCHVIPAFDVPNGWAIYRSFDWGYSRPFSCGYWAVDYDGIAYRIAEFYGCTGEPNEGVKWDAGKVFDSLAEYERDHPLLRGKQITGVADPAIWDVSRGESVAETAAKRGIYFTPGDHKRIQGWMQMHYRLAFDQNGRARMYIFDTCREFIRTIPLLEYDTTHVEDLNTEGEDHIADECRYFCMSRPVTPLRIEEPEIHYGDPLNMFTDTRR